MSGLSTTLDRLRKAYAAIGDAEAVALNFPNDRYVAANISALRHDAARLESDWEKESLRNRLEVIRYRIMPNFSDRYNLSDVTRSLLDFQALVSQIFDAVSGNAKAVARVSAEAADATAFEFGFSYPGSLGVALFLEGDALGGKFDASFDALLQIVSLKDEYEIRDVSRSLGKAVVRKTYDWAKINYAANYAIDLSWRTSTGRFRSDVIGTSDYARLIQLIEFASEQEANTNEYEGTLIGIDAATRRFRFVVPAGDDMAGTIDKDFTIRDRWAINTRYRATIRTEEITSYATEETKRTYHLTHLENDETA